MKRPYPLIGDTAALVFTGFLSYLNRDIPKKGSFSPIQLTSAMKIEDNYPSLDEFDYSPYNCLKDMLEIEPGKYRIAHLENRIPMVYAVLATKK